MSGNRGSSPVSRTSKSELPFWTLVLLCGIAGALVGLLMAYGISFIRDGGASLSPTPDNSVATDQEAAAAAPDESAQAPADSSQTGSLETPQANGTTPAAGQGVLVCIDPGHPSEVNSARTVQNGVTELDMNWQVAQRLAGILQSQGISVCQTKSSRDDYVTNRERAETANRSGAALLLRLHCDTGGGSGYALYYPDRQGTAQGVTGPSTEVITGSRQAATVISSGMTKILGGSLRGNGVKGDSATYVGGKQGALTGSIFSRIPSVTVEMVFLSNKADAAFISSEQGQDKMARALANGVAEYLRSIGKIR